MKKTIFLAAILIAALGFTGCGGSDKNGGSLKIDAKVSNGDLVNSQVDEVRAIGTIYFGGGDWEDVIIATAPFKNGGFKITLPETFDQRLLYKINFESLFPEIPNISISDKNVKGMNFWDIYAFKNNLLVGLFRCMYDIPYKEGTLYFMFVYSDCKVVGSHTEAYPTYKNEFTVDLNLKKGWNMVYETRTTAGDTRIYKTSTQKPDFDLAWYFQGGVFVAPPKK